MPDFRLGSNEQICNFSVSDWMDLDKNLGKEFRIEARALNLNGTMKFNMNR